MHEFAFPMKTLQTREIIAKFVKEFDGEKK